MEPITMVNNLHNRHHHHNNNRQDMYQFQQHDNNIFKSSTTTMTKTTRSKLSPKPMKTITTNGNKVASRAISQQKQYLPSLQLLACYEDSSFIYSQQQQNSSSSISTSNSLASKSFSGDSSSSPSSSSSSTSSTSFTSSSSDSMLSDSSHPSSSVSVYLEDDQVFYNLQRCQELGSRDIQDTEDGADSMDVENSIGQKQQQQPLSGQLRHSLLSWMLNVCEHQMCQDEIFPLATMILDKFLLLHNQRQPQEQRRRFQQQQQQQQSKQPAIKMIEGSHDREQEEDEDLLCCEELRHRQLYLFAACALLLATKLRQTPRLYIQTLIEFSKSELPIELNREEILDGELLILATLKWDLASLVTPNDFIAVILGKCRNLLVANLDRRGAPLVDVGGKLKIEHQDDDDSKIQTRNSINDINNENTSNIISLELQEYGSRVKRHTQSLLELCLMDSQLSQFSPSILAMASMAVAIDGLSMTEKTCWRLEDIVTNIHEATHKVNELKLMIEVSFQIEKYVQKLLNSTHDD